MALEKFIDRKFSPGSMELIVKANEILQEYKNQGLVLTLRQLYYQFVARGLIPNKQTEYKRLGSVVSDARMAGLIDWAMMEDRTRELERIPAWDSPQSIVDAVASQYQEDLWIGQPYRPEVWVEKDALVGVIERACADLRVNHFACRGYASQSSQYDAGKRFARTRHGGQKPIVFHLGDHDPSGIDMSRDITDRITLFARNGIEVRRIALNWDQVQQYNPPPNPAKETDSRASGYIDQFGGESWELDALNPTIIDQLIRDNITPLIDGRLWDRAKEREADNKSKLEEVSARWDEVKEYLESN